MLRGNKPQLTTILAQFEWAVCWGVQIMSAGEALMSLPDAFFNNCLLTPLTSVPCAFFVWFAGFVVGPLSELSCV
eukprot:5932509-Amphidinium_carterae.1